MDDEDDGFYVEYSKHPIKCAKEGHCFCWKNGGSHCCWCGESDSVRAKKNFLSKLRREIRKAKEHYPEEVQELLKEMIE